MCFKNMEDKERFVTMVKMHAVELFGNWPNIDQILDYIDQQYFGPKGTKTFGPKYIDLSSEEESLSWKDRSLTYDEFSVQIKALTFSLRFVNSEYDSIVLGKMAALLVKWTHESGDTTLFPIMKIATDAVKWQRQLHA